MRDFLQDILNDLNNGSNGSINSAKTKISKRISEFDEREQEKLYEDLDKCPQCGGQADNGHDRCIPPNPYLCTECESKIIRLNHEYR